MSLATWRKPVLLALVFLNAGAVSLAAAHPPIGPEWLPAVLAAFGAATGAVLLYERPPLSAETRADAVAAQLQDALDQVK
jgi:hypothetical protein